MDSNPTQFPAWWEETSHEPCGRLTKAGTPCRNGRSEAAVYAGPRRFWESPACMVHLTQEEREAREAAEARVRAALAEIEPACWSWPAPPTSVEDLLGRLFAPDDPFFAELVRCFDINDLVFGAFHDGRCAICGCAGRLVQDHDHSTGMIRGKLCCGCNTQEGFSHLPLFEKYRARNPASILGVQLPYTGIGWVDGVPVGGWASQVDRRPRSIESVWIDNPTGRLGL